MKPKKIPLLLILIPGLLFSSCTFNKLKREKIGESLITDVISKVDSAAYTAKKTKEQIQKLEKNFLTHTNISTLETNLSKINQYNDFSILFLDQSQRLLGRPTTINKNLPKLFTGSENNQSHAKERMEKEWEKTLDKIEKRDNLIGGLIDMGEKYEQERNAKIKRNWKIAGWLGGILGLLSLPAILSIVFPPVGGLLLSVFPFLTKVFRFVPKTLLSRTVQGIGKARSFFKENRKNPDATYTATEVYERINSSLAEKTDESDKKIIKYFKAENGC